MQNSPQGAVSGLNSSTEFLQKLRINWLKTVRRGLFLANLLHFEPEALRIPHVESETQRVIRRRIVLKGLFKILACQLRARGSQNTPR